jgi:hypothetical protein
MQQAALFDGLRFNLLSLSEDGLGPAEVDVGRCEDSEALVVALMNVVLDEAGDGLLECTGQVVVLEKDAVLQSLVPPLDLALGLRMTARTTSADPPADANMQRPRERSTAERTLNPAKAQT